MVIAINLFSMILGAFLAGGLFVFGAYTYISKVVERELHLALRKLDWLISERDALIDLYSNDRISRQFAKGGLETTLSTARNLADIIESLYVTPSLRDAKREATEAAREVTFTTRRLVEMM